jgi:hypothetical protein
MNSMVIYGSRHGNTHKVAEAIAGASANRPDHSGLMALLSFLRGVLVEP